jgi:1-acyl-sn-glycerol-3-phosphate acyltransferase
MLAKLMGWLLLGIVRVLTGAQARWYGCPPKAEQRIYFANHQSHADLVMIWAALPAELRGITRPIAAKDYWTKTPFKKWITTSVFNAVYVDRERTEGIDPLQPLVDALKQGDSVILFPEGTRGNEELPQRFKSGLYNLALRFPNVVLVPAWINNIQRVMPKGEVVPVPILCSVTFGAPMQVLRRTTVPGEVETDGEKFSATPVDTVEQIEDHAAFAERARNAVIALRDI